MNKNNKTKTKVSRTAKQSKSLSDYVALALSTVGVGYLPLAPGTWGSAVGVLIFIGAREIETTITRSYLLAGYSQATVVAWDHAAIAVLLFLLCSTGIWSAARTSILLKLKDPPKVVIDEVMGQLITFLFVPFSISWKYIFAGFLLFRLFDIWKPYPIDLLQDLPGGLGICLDDVLAGVYAGIALMCLHALGTLLG